MSCNRDDLKAWAEAHSKEPMPMPVAIAVKELLEALTVPEEHKQAIQRLKRLKRYGGDETSADVYGDQLLGKRPAQDIDVIWKLFIQWVRMAT